MENNKKKFDDANKTLKIKMWILILSIVGGIYLFSSSELTIPLIVMMCITIILFGFDYLTWNIFLMNMREKKFIPWIKVAGKLIKNKKDRKKIENKLVYSAILIMGLSFAFGFFNPLYVQIIIGCVLVYILYLYYSYSSLELIEKIPDIIRESRQ